MLGYLSVDIICSQKWTVFQECSVLIILQIFFTTCTVLKIGEYILNNSCHLSVDIICSEKRTVFREQSSMKTASYEEQTMSEDKYLSIFSPQMEAIVFIILQIFFAMRTVLKIGEYSRIFPSFSWGIFGQVMRLGQLRMSEKIWWIIVNNYSLKWLSKYPPLSPTLRWIIVLVYTTQAE